MWKSWPPYYGRSPGQLRAANAADVSPPAGKGVAEMQSEE